MGYFEDAKELIVECKSTIKEIKAAYDESLSEQAIKPKLLIKIKNFMENLRSALDFTAHGLFDKYGDHSADTNIYFPYAWEGLDKTGFQSKKRIEKCIPGIMSNRPDIALKIESYQHFESTENRWLPIFMDLNNENKHQKLTPQTRKEIRELRISSDNVGIRISGNAGIKITGNAYIKIGNSIITGNQNITPNNPANIHGNAKQEIIIWVSFHFSSNDEPVYPLLEKALTGTEKIVEELSKI